MIPNEAFKIQQTLLSNPAALRQAEILVTLKPNMLAIQNCAKQSAALAKISPTYLQAVANANKLLAQADFSALEQAVKIYREYQPIFTAAEKFFAKMNSLEPAVVEQNLSALNACRLDDTTQLPPKVEQETVGLFDALKTFPFKELFKVFSLSVSLKTLTNIDINNLTVFNALNLLIFAVNAFSLLGDALKQQDSSSQ